MINDGYVRVKPISIKIDIADVDTNLKRIKEELVKAQQENVSVASFQELTLTGYTVGDLFFNELLLDRVLVAIEELKEFSKEIDFLFIVGAPIKKNNSLYNSAITFYHGHILGVNVKTYIPSYREYYEKRYFESAPKGDEDIVLCNEKVPFGNNIIYRNINNPFMCVGVEICEDLWAVQTPSSAQVEAGATIIANLSASNELVGKAAYRHDLVKMSSARMMCAYIYSSSGDGESTSDVVYGGHKMIAENGKMLFESEPFKNEDGYADIDLEIISHERSVNTSFMNKNENIRIVDFTLELKKIEKPHRRVDKNPFVPEDEDILGRVDSILEIQAMGLAQRLSIIHTNFAVIGLSGGLDSTLALLVTCEAFDYLNIDRKNIHALTLPCFGTSERTKHNAIQLAKVLGVTLKEIDISEAVRIHLRDIGHDINSQNVTYENAQARERAQVLFDYANDLNALLVGTGDLSEQCLGWTTYNGDHMSSYSVNVSIPKTLVIYICRGYAYKNKEAKEVLEDILDTPISPELIPAKEGRIAQKTEDIIGPYEFHDFVLYYFLRYGFAPRKIYNLATMAFDEVYQNSQMKSWLKIFFKRFFQNQFKRNCLPDGPKVGNVAISPRGDLRMPSDASAKGYLEDIEKL